MTRLNAVKKAAIALLAPLVLLVVVVLCAPIGWAFPASGDTKVQYQFQIIHSFGGPGDGASADGLVMDGAGNLYGASENGPDGGGTVFELTPGENSQWTETILHDFPVNDPSDGYNPIGRLAIDQAGNLYGATVFGGAHGHGTVYELSPGGNGEWTESIIWNFCSLPNCADAGSPLVAPTLGPGGSLYGTTVVIAYQLTPGSGGWTFNLLYTDTCNVYGCGLESSLTLHGGNLYGEENNGECCGQVYVLQPQPNGQWDLTVVYDFPNGTRESGSVPRGGLTFHDGGLYGDTAGGGSNCVKNGGCGTVFELTRGLKATTINEQVIWSFGGDAGAQGVNPGDSWVAFNKQGDLFGVTGLGGESGDGVVYGMKPQPNATWKYAVLHQFIGTDGVDPNAGLLIDSKDNLYGTTGGGGEYGYGVAFELSPTTQASK